MKNIFWLLLLLLFLPNSALFAKQDSINMELRTFINDILAEPEKIMHIEALYTNLYSKDLISDVFVNKMQMSIIELIKNKYLHKTLDSFDIKIDKLSKFSIQGGYKDKKIDLTLYFYGVSLSIGNKGISFIFAKKHDKSYFCWMNKLSIMEQIDDYIEEKDN